METILLQAIGFYLMIMPEMLLTFVPFDTDKSYRFPRHMVIKVAGIGTIFFTLLFILLWPRYASTMSINIYTDAFMLFSVMLFILYYIVTVKEPFVKKMLTFSLSVFIVIEIFLIRIVMASYMETLFIGGYSWMGLLILALLTIGFCFPGYSINEVILRRYAKYDFRGPSAKYANFVLLGMWGFFLILICYLFMFTNNQQSWLKATPMLVFCSIMILLFYGYVLKATVEQFEKEQLTMLHASSIMQYQKIDREVDAAKRERHDLKHHLANMYAMAGNNDMEGIKRYLSEMLGRIELTSSEKFSNNASLNHLLQYYIGWAKDEQINCEVLADVPQYLINDADLTILFGNILENAVLSAKECKKTKWINLKTEAMGNYLAILVENSCESIHPSSSYNPGGIFQDADAFQSIRFGKNYGLRSITAVAEKYGGKAEFKYDKSRTTFTTRVLLDLSTAGEKK